MQKSFFISTSIPYVNAAPHLGHALEFVQADILARYYRLKGDDVFFLTGTDENALKNAQSAAEAGMLVREFVDTNASRFNDLDTALSISYDDFIRTSVDERHRRGAEKLWRALAPEDVYKKKYRGLYCLGCEEFKLGKELVDGKCPEHPNRPLEEVEEENYFFRLSRYGKQIEEFITSNTLHIIPETRKNETLSFLRGGLEDLSISRSRERSRDWGLPVPDDDAQIQYVWVEALSNYITALGFADNEEKFQRYWQEGGETLHVIGKGINRFHTVYWPAILLSAGVRLPKTVFVHGYITMDGQKMSKSLGNTIDPFELIENYGRDAVRYYLAREIATFEDGDITRKKFHEAYNANLANGIGNLTARIMRLAEVQLDTPMETLNGLLPEAYTRALDEFEIQKAADVVWEYITALDRRIQEEKPWSIVGDKHEAEKTIRGFVSDLFYIARMLEPFLPDTAEKIKLAIAKNHMPAALFPRKDPPRD